MKVLVTGSSGLIGSALTPSLTAGGHSVVRLVRSTTDRNSGSVRWDPVAGTLDRAALEGFDAVVHLAGEDISAGKWTAAKKARIRQSRVDGTGLLARTLASLARPPGVLACASAIGYYGNRGDEILTEESGPGAGFLAAVCRDWEAAATPAREAGIRVVHLRFGVILSVNGGALARMLGPFRLGMGGPLGSGRQYVSWVAIDDAVAAIGHVLSIASLRGAVNVASPGPVTHAEFARALGRVLGRPTVLGMPVFAVRLMFGEMADELILSSQRLAPTRLLSSGYEFRFPQLEGALRHLLRSA
ncbi:MAG TPA: TIGR01777 family oxidoreductase [Candidatus Methylomirabilis sp.]|nr:TIGR01777 family oxidoreductase [Candidatus Methylomirabilis sp.]